MTDSARSLIFLLAFWVVMAVFIVLPGSGSQVIWFWSLDTTYIKYILSMLFILVSAAMLFWIFAETKIVWLLDNVGAAAVNIGLIGTMYSLCKGFLDIDMDALASLSGLKAQVSAIIAATGVALATTLMGAIVAVVCQAYKTGIQLVGADK